MKITINGKPSLLMDLVLFVAGAKNPSWRCVCGKWNRGKDLRCWDGGCGRTRQEGDVTKK